MWWGQGATALLALQLGTKEPHFTLVLAGEPLLTVSSPAAPFTTLLLLLHSANIDTGDTTWIKSHFLALSLNFASNTLAADCSNE